MNLKFKKWQIFAASILLLLIILNPGLKDFREYSGDRDVTKKMNFLVVSIYEDGSDSYIGFLLNFIKLPKISYSQNNVNVPQLDTMAVPSTESNTSTYKEYDTALINKLVKEFSDERKQKSINAFYRKMPKTKKDPFILDSTDNQLITSWKDTK